MKGSMKYGGNEAPDESHLRMFSEKKVQKKSIEGIKRCL